MTARRPVWRVPLAALVALIAAPGSSRGSPPQSPPPSGGRAKEGKERAPALAVRDAGVLSPPSGAPPRAIARAFLLSRGAAAGTLSSSRVVALADGSLVVLRLGHRGLPVFGGGAAVRLDRRGRVRWARARLPAIPPGLSPAPALSAERAIARARAVTGAQSAASVDLYVWAPAASAPRLAYRVDLAFDPIRRSAPRVWVDAVRGRILGSEERVSFARPRANAYEVSPVETPELEEVTLEALEEGADGLDNGELAVYGCPDTNTCSEVFPGVFLHTCEPTARAVPDGNGDYLQYTFESDTARDDEFSEVQAFWHTSRALARLRRLGFQGLDAAPLAVIVNWKKLDVSSAPGCGGDQSYQGAQELEPFDNAMFAPGGDPDGVRAPGDALVFGQGHTIDFAYDGDVVYHELGHAVTATVAPELTHGFVDRYGFDPTPAGMHEAFSDFLTVSMTGDPEIGEYAGSGFADGAGRDLKVARGCPADLVGEPHEDSLPLSGALWQLRRALGTSDEKRDLFDRAVLSAWSALDETGDFPAAAFLISSELEIELGAGARAVADQVFAARGVSTCDPRILDGDVPKALFTLPAAADESGEPVVLPGPFQIRYRLSERADEIAVEVGLFDPLAAGGDALVALKPGEEPILWRDDGDGWTGDFADSAPLEIDDDRRGRATLPGPFEPGTYTLMLVNRGVAARVHDLRVTHVPAATGGCGCEATSTPAPFWLLILLLAGFQVSGRRSQRQGAGIRSQASGNRFQGRKRDPLIPETRGLNPEGCNLPLKPET